MTLARKGIDKTKKICYTMIVIKKRLDGIHGWCRRLKIGRSSFDSDSNHHYASKKLVRN